MRYVLAALISLTCMGLVACSQTDEPSSEPSSQVSSSEPIPEPRDVICNIGDSIHTFTCSEINAQPDCPRCTG